MCVVWRNDSEEEDEEEEEHDNSKSCYIFSEDDWTRRKCYVFYYSIDELPARSNSRAIRTPMQASASSWRRSGILISLFTAA